MRRKWRPHAGMRRTPESMAARARRPTPPAWHTGAPHRVRTRRRRRGRRAQYCPILPWPRNSRWPQWPRDDPRPLTILESGSRKNDDPKGTTWHIAHQPQITPSKRPRYSERCNAPRPRCCPCPRICARYHVPTSPQGRLPAGHETSACLTHCRPSQSTR